jgi:hypothetical protein
MVTKVRQRLSVIPSRRRRSPVVDAPVTRPIGPIVIDRSVRALPGIDLRLNAQRSLLTELASFYPEQPFTETPVAGGPRYSFENGCYSYSDALFLYGMLLRFEPARLIEVGSGYTSVLALDVKDRFLPGLDCTFIEPYPERYLSLCRPGDDSLAALHVQLLQSVDPKLFSPLGRNDILLIDSSHIDAPGSDVRLLLTAILPSLKSGVLVHFHDMFWPFEYPDVWQGNGWNEIHAVRDFLRGNAAFEIVVWNEFLARTDRDFLAHTMPLCLRNTGGSLWLRKR